MSNSWLIDMGYYYRTQNAGKGYTEILLLYSKINSASNKNIPSLLTPEIIIPSRYAADNFIQFILPVI